MREHRAATAAANADGFRNNRERIIAATGLFTGLYFLACEGFIKVGVSVSVDRRFYSIQSANPFEVLPLGFIHTAKMGEAIGLEDAFKIRFSALNHRGEWFVDAPEIREHIAAHAQPWPIQRSTANNSDQNAQNVQSGL